MKFILATTTACLTSLFFIVPALAQTPSVIDETTGFQRKALGDQQYPTNTIRLPDPPSGVFLSPEFDIRAMAFERQLLTLDSRQLKLLDALANGSPRAARIMVDGIKIELGYHEARSNLQEFSDFLNSVPRDQRVEALNKGLQFFLKATHGPHGDEISGLPLLETIKRFDDGPIATLRYYFPDPKLDEETLQRLKLPGDGIVRHYRDRDDDRWLTARRLVVLDKLSKNEKITRAEMKLLPFRTEIGFMKDDVDDVLSAIGQTLDSGDPFGSDATLLATLFADLDRRARELSHEFHKLGLNGLAGELDNIFKQTKAVMGNTADRDIRGQAHAQMLHTLDHFQTKLLMEVYKSGLSNLSSRQLRELEKRLKPTGVNKDNIPPAFTKVIVGSVDLSDWHDKDWAQGFKLANNTASLFRSLAVLSGDEDTARIMATIGTGIEITSQMFKGFATMADAANNASSVAAAASFMGGVGLVVGAAVALEAMSKESAEEIKWEQLYSFLTELHRVARNSLHQGQQNQALILGMRADLAQIESRVISQIDVLAEGQSAILEQNRRAFERHSQMLFSEVERDANIYIRDNTQRNKISSERSLTGEISVETGREAAAFILQLMLQKEVTDSKGINYIPATPNIKDFVEAGNFGFSWRALSNVGLEDETRDFHQLSTEAKLRYIFGEDGPLSAKAKIDVISDAINHLYYPIALTGSMETLELLAKYNPPNELSYLAYQATRARAMEFLEAQKTLRQHLVSVVFERFDAFRRMEIAYGNLMLASASSASAAIDNGTLHNLYVDYAWPHQNNSQDLVDKVRVLRDYGISDLVEPNYYNNLDNLYDEVPPRRQMRNYHTLGNGIGVIGSSLARYFNPIKEALLHSADVVSRAQALGLITIHEPDQVTENTFKFKYIDIETGDLIGYRTYGQIPIEFDGWVWKRNKSDIGYVDYEITKGRAKGTLFYSGVVQYNSEDIENTLEFGATRRIPGGYNIPVLDTQSQGILGYFFKEVRAQTWKEIKDKEVKEMNFINQEKADKLLRDAREMQDIWIRVLEETLRKTAKKNQAEITQWFVAMLRASRDGKVASIMNTDNASKVFGVFAAENIAYDGEFNFAFGDGSEFIKTNLENLQKAIRDVEALNWYTAYSLSAAYGDCARASSRLVRTIVATLPEFIRWPEAIVATTADIYGTIPLQMQNATRSAYETLEDIEDLSARFDRAFLGCEASHGVAPRVRAMDASFNEISNAYRARELGTLFRKNELRN